MHKARAVLIVLAIRLGFRRSAACDNEIALDSPTQGGIATRAWSDCIVGAVIDKDGSGGLSAQKIQECAQRRIDEAVRFSKDVLSHHVTITGNASTVLAFSKSQPLFQAAPTVTARPPRQPPRSTICSAAATIATASKSGWKNRS